MERPPRPRHRETPVVPLRAHVPPATLRTAGGLALADPVPAPVPAPAEPLRPTTSIPTTPAGVRGARARRATKERQAHDGWTFVVVPPGLNARPRTLHISVRRFRFATLALATTAGTAVFCGALLAFLFSVTPPVENEAAGIALGVFNEEPVAPRTQVPQEMDLLSLLAIGPAAATVAMPEKGATKVEETVGPRVAKAERRRPIAAPSMSGRRETRAPVMAASMEGLPVIGRITSRFSSSRRHPVLGVVRPHRGLDIAANSGTPITAPAPGRVVFAGRKFGFGNVVEIDHGHGIITRYAHCRSLHVKRGMTVETGATIATVGRTGLASGPHLHFEVLVDGRSVDPLKQRVETLLASRAPAPAPEAPKSIFFPGIPGVAPAASPTAAAADSASTAVPVESAREGTPGGSAGR